MEQFRTVPSCSDSLPLDVLEVLPQGKPRAIVQIVHGMKEHKERYLHFMRYLASCGIGSVVHDHRGHGKSVCRPEDLGYFSKNGADAMVEDVLDVSQSMRSRYPDAPWILFGHSMGSLVVRKYLKTHDDTVHGLIISGAVYENPGAKPGRIVLRALGLKNNDRRVSPLAAKLVDGDFDKKVPGTQKNRWLSYNEENVAAFNRDELCGFEFSLNAYDNLLKLVLDVYDPQGWQMKNPNLPVLFVAGQDDPVIGGPSRFQKTVQDLKDKGYKNTRSILYPHMRHEILNETGRMDVYRDLLRFIEEIV